MLVDFIILSKAIGGLHFYCIEQIDLPDQLALAYEENYLLAPPLLPPLAAMSPVLFKLIKYGIHTYMQTKKTHLVNYKYIHNALYSLFL